MMDTLETALAHTHKGSLTNNDFHMLTAKETTSRSPDEINKEKKKVKKTKGGRTSAI